MPVAFELHRVASRRLNSVVCGLWVLFAFAATVDARVYAPRVVSPHNADAYSMRTFAGFHRWRDLQGDAKAWAIFEYLTDRRTGLYPMGAGAWEGRDKTYDFGLIRDPVKMINVYSVGYCDVLGPVMAGIWQDMGLGRSRTVDLPDWHHVVSEVHYGGKWHYLDLDLRAAFRRYDGSLASLDEARRDASLWKQPRGPRFFPMDRIENVQKVYQSTAVRHRHQVHMSGHTLDYVLRSGETFTRWWKPQQGRWNHNESYHTNPSRKRMLESSPPGPKSKHASFTKHTHGNGRFEYAPNLTTESLDFADGVYDSENIAASATGLTLIKPGRGHAIFEIRSPYVIVPQVGDFADTADDKEASVVELDADIGTAVDVSLDNGLTWRSIDVSAWPARLDLTQHAAGRYGYLLRLSISGNPQARTIRSLRITTWVQLAPAALPSLRRGQNRMQFQTGDHYGLQTRVMEIRPDSSQPTEMAKYFVERPADYDSTRRSSRMRGPFVVRVSAPPNSKITWFSAGGSFQTHQQQAARNTRNSMAYAVGQPRDFIEFYRADVPTDTEHWHYNASREVRLDRPAKTVFVRYIGDPAVNNIRIYAHCVDDAKSAAQPVRVLHVWHEGSARKTFSTTVNGSDGYVINVDGEPEDESIELAIPSSRPVTKN